MRRFFDFRLLGIAMIALALTAAAGSAQSRRNSSEGRLLRDAAARESRGDFSGAEELLRQLLEEDPASSGGLHALERVLRARGETARILPAVDTFLEHEPSSSGVRYLKLRLLMELDSLDELERMTSCAEDILQQLGLPFRTVVLCTGDMGFGARRTFDLDITASAERDAFTLWQLEHEFLDKGGDVVVRADFARPALHAEDLVRNLDFHVLLDLHLAGEAASLAGFAAIDVPRLRRENRAATFAEMERDTLRALTDSMRADNVRLRGIVAGRETAPTGAEPIMGRPAASNSRMLAV